MRLMLDACALVPSVLRRLLLAHAGADGFEPLWSERVLEEWARAAERLRGPEGAGEARAAAAAMRAAHPRALVEGWEALEDPAGLPDAADAHVIAAARAGGADGVVTLNIRDFPLRALSAHRLARSHPDDFLRLEYAPGEALDRALDALAAEPGAPPLSARLKRAGLPRLAKARREARGGG